MLAFSCMLTQYVVEIMTLRNDIHVEVFSLLVYAVNKQLSDKERVAAALENPNLVDMVDECLAPSYDWTVVHPCNVFRLIVCLSLWSMATIRFYYLSKKKKKILFSCLIHVVLSF